MNRIKSYFFHEGFLKYFINTFWYTLEQGLRVLSSIFVGVLVARYLGPEKFGILSYIIAITGFLGGISKLGIDNILVRELVKYPKKSSIYLGTAFWLKLSGALILICGAKVFLQKINSNSIENNLIFIASTGFIFQSFDVIDFYFQSLIRAKIISICKIFQLVLSALIKIYLIHIEADLIWFVLISILDGFSLAISLFLSYKFEKGPSFFRHYNHKYAKTIIRDSLPLLLSSMIVTIYMRVDQIMIKEMIGNEKAGIYAVAVRLTEALYFIPIIISTSLFPAIINSKKLSPEQYHDRLQKLFNFLTRLAIIIALAITLLADWIINIFFGQDYANSSEILKINIWASVFVFGGVAGGKWIVTENLQQYSNYFLLLGMLLNLLLNFLLIPKLELVGSAIATVLSQMTAAIIAPALFKKTRLQTIMLLKALVPIKINLLK